MPPVDEKVFSDFDPVDQRCTDPAKAEDDVEYATRLGLFAASSSGAVVCLAGLGPNQGSINTTVQDFESPVTPGGRVFLKQTQFPQSHTFPAMWSVDRPAEPGVYSYVKQGEAQRVASQAAYMLPGNRAS